MAKKGTGRKKPKVERARTKKVTKHVDVLMAMSREERNRFLESAPLEQLLEVLDESYASDLINVLLDLKKSAVKRFLEVLGPLRRRAVQEAATLFYYKEYLTNPLPLRVETMTGLRLPNYYAILGVPRDVSDDDLKSAYRLLARAYHPESFSPAMRRSAEERLGEIDDAFDNLKTPQKREKTDRLLPNISYLYPRRDQSWLETVQRILG